MFKELLDGSKSIDELKDLGVDADIIFEMRDRGLNRICDVLEYPRLRQHGVYPDLIGGVARKICDVSSALAVLDEAASRETVLVCHTLGYTFWLKRVGSQFVLQYQPDNGTEWDELETEFYNDPMVLACRMVRHRLFIWHTAKGAIL